MIPNKETVLKENCPDLPPAFPVPFLWVDYSNDDDVMKIIINIMIIIKHLFVYQTHFWISAYGLPWPALEKMDNNIGLDINQNHPAKDCLETIIGLEKISMIIPGPRIRSQDILRPQNKCPSQEIDKLNLCRFQQMQMLLTRFPTDQTIWGIIYESTQIL